jgi:hypothetical protein
MRSVIDELRAMQVFYVNVGGGEPTVRPDFWELLDYAVASGVGVKFSTNGLRLDAERARRLAATDYVDVQISLDGASADVNDAVRGEGSYAMALRAMEHLAEAGFPNFKSQGGCMAAKFFTGLPLDGPDPECVKGHGADALAAAGRSESPRADKDHSHRSRPAQPIRPPGPTSRGRAVSLGMPAVHVPARPCDSSPLATVL